MILTHLHILGGIYVLQRVKHPQHGFAVLIIRRRRENSEWDIRELERILD